MQIVPKNPDMARARQQRSAQAEQRILAAAERVFAESGFGGATMAALAAAAGLPAANLHYHFGTKKRLYEALLENILHLWLEASDSITADASPAAALSAYIAAKMRYSRTRPYASKVFANEVLQGGVHLHSFLGLELRRRVDEKAEILEGWMRKGLMERVDPRHLFFLLWAMTQTYADFETQIRAVLGRAAVLAPEDYAVGEALIKRLVLRGCGLSFSEMEINP